MQGLGHRLVVATGDLQYEVFVEVLGDFVDGINSGNKLILLLPRIIKDPIGILSPLGLYEVPYPFYRVELTALWREELAGEPFIVKFLLHNLAVVDAEVVHHNYAFMQRVDPLELFDEGEERIDCV